jgi:hypothetical protein
MEVLDFWRAFEIIFLKSISSGWLVQLQQKQVARHAVVGDMT